jgi:hypothetical protein
MRRPGVLTPLALTTALGAGLVSLSAGCTQTRYRSGEGQYCSTNEDEDPHYSCVRSQDLVCISTYSVQVLADGGQAESRFRDLYLCRLSCSPNEGCPAAGDVCCPGKIYGRTYNNSMYACVPEANCETLTGEPDAGPRPDASADRGGDGAGSRDAPGPADAAGTGDAPAGADAAGPADAAGAATDAVAG